MTGGRGPAETQFEKKIQLRHKMKGEGGFSKIWNVSFIFFWSLTKYLSNIHEEFSQILSQECKFKGGTFELFG